jgi:hypothetical protein
MNSKRHYLTGAARNINALENKFYLSASFKLI